MAKYSNSNLQPNPFVTYRDPQTGLWVVLHNATVAQSSASINSQELQSVKSAESKRVNHFI